MVVVKRELVSLKSGVALETAVAYPPPECHSTRAAFCLHPWSWLGGCMDDPTIQTIVKLLVRLNIYVVYYNSRGVGRSTGHASFTGRQEGEDLQELVQHFLHNEPHITSVTILGYSYGSLIATLHPVLAPPIKTSYVLLSYPLTPRGLLTLFHTRVYSAALDGLLDDSRANVLIIYGDRDDFTGKARYDAWSEMLQETSEAKARLDIVSVAGAGHFWRSNSSRTTLRRTLEDWLLIVIG
ncbi:Alpha/Beta hydrolase protein [Scleroderma yunnanense]